MRRASQEEPTNPGVSTTEPRRDPLSNKVWAERYELRSRVSFDELFLRYRALDQETDDEVLISVLRSELHTHKAERLRARAILNNRVGMGGAHLSPLLDADLEGPYVFAVEALRSGLTMRTLLDQQLAQGETFVLEDVLALVLSLRAALDAIPPELAHGHVCAENVLVEDEHVWLTRPFLLHAVSTNVLKDAVNATPAWQQTLDPLVLRGGPSRASDRWGVACITLEALTGSTRLSAIDTLRDAHPKLAQALEALLSPALANRPASLDGLVAELAAAAKMRVPTVDAAPYHRRPLRGVVPTTDLQLDADDATQEYEIEDLEPPPSSTNTMPVVALHDHDKPAVRRSEPPRPPAPPKREAERDVLATAKHSAVRADPSTIDAQRTQKLTKIQLRALLSDADTEPTAADSAEQSMPAPLAAPEVARAPAITNERPTASAVENRPAATVPTSDMTPSPISMMQVLPSVEVRKSMFAKPKIETPQHTQPIPLVALRQTPQSKAIIDGDAPEDSPTFARKLDDKVKPSRNQTRSVIVQALIVAATLLIVAVALALWQRARNTERLEQQRMEEQIRRMRTK